MGDLILSWLFSTLKLPVKGELILSLKLAATLHYGASVAKSYGAQTGWNFVLRTFFLSILSLELTGNPGIFSRFCP